MGIWLLVSTAVHDTTMHTEDTFFVCEQQKPFCSPEYTQHWNCRVIWNFEEPSTVVPLHASAPPLPMEAEEKPTNTFSWYPRVLLGESGVWFYGWWESGLQMATLLRCDSILCNSTAIHAAGYQHSPFSLPQRGNPYSLNSLCSSFHPSPGLNHLLFVWLCLPGCFL